MEGVVVDGSARFVALLDEFNRIHGASAAPVTFLEAAGYPNYENVASNLLRFFLDPNEGHGLADLFLGALIEPLGFEGVSVRAVEREVRTLHGKFIDVLIEGGEHLIGVENKIFAAPYNPFDEYIKHLQRHAQGREVAMLLLCLHEPQPAPAGVTVVTYEQFMGRVRRDLGRVATEVPAQYLTFALDFVRTMENRKKGERMNPAVTELLKKRGDDILELLGAVEAFRGENRAKGNELRARVEELVAPEVRKMLRTRYWPVPSGLDGASVHDIDFPSGEEVTVDAWIGAYGWEVTVFQRRTPGRKLSAGELEAWLRERGAEFLVAPGTTALEGSRPVTARFERDAQLDVVAQHMLSVVTAIASAQAAPGEAPSP